MTPIDGRITEALGEPLTASQRAALDARVHDAVRARPAVRRRGLPYRRSVLLAAILMILLPSAFVVTAAILSTENPMGLATPAEFAAELDAAKGVVPLPAGRTWPSFLAADPTVGGYSRGGGRSWVENVAMCEWFDEWLDARAIGAGARERAAAATVASIPDWPSWNSPFWDQSVRDHYAPIIEAVGVADEGPVRAELPLNCSWLAAR